MVTSHVQCSWTGQKHFPKLCDGLCIYLFTAQCIQNINAPPGKHSRLFIAEICMTRPLEENGSSLRDLAKIDPLDARAHSWGTIWQLFSRKLHISVPGRSDFVVRRFVEQEVNDVAAAAGLQAGDRNQWCSRLADTTENHHSDGTRQKCCLSSCNWTKMPEEESNGTHGHMNNLPFMRNLLLILHSDFPHRHKLALHLSPPHFWFYYPLAHLLPIPHLPFLTLRCKWWLSCVDIRPWQMKCDCSSLATTSILIISVICQDQERQQGGWGDRNRVTMMMKEDLGCILALAEGWGNLDFPEVETST